MKFKPTTTVVDIARSTLLDDLGHSALVVYLRLVAASAEQGKHMTIKNRHLHRNPRTAAAVMGELKKAKLVRVTFKDTDDGRVRVVELT